MNVPLKLWKRKKNDLCLYKKKKGFKIWNVLRFYKSLYQKLDIWMSLVDLQEHNKSIPFFMLNSLLVDWIQYFNRMLSRKFIKIKVSYVS